MFLDKQLMFSEDQAITATAASTNVLDLGLGDAGRSDIEIYVRVGETFTNLTSLTVLLQTATDAAFTSPVSLPVSATKTLATLTANAEVLKAKMPHGCLRYVRIYYTVTGTAPDAGKVTAGLILDRQANP